ncbi:MAG: SPOR domain-containing protein, partial [Candidatus Zixiibacteriota bacterium]
VAVVPEEPEAPTMPKRPEGAGYTVQVAGCESQEYARHLIGLYTERGYEPYMTTITIEGQLFYRVRMGLFPSVAEASRLRADLNDRFSIEAWIDYTN